MSEKPKRRWFRFGLRTMFVVVTLAAVALGGLAYRRDAYLKAKAERERQEMFKAELNASASEL